MIFASMKVMTLQRKYITCVIGLLFFVHLNICDDIVISDT